MDVLRAGQSEVMHYTRIEFGTSDRDGKDLVPHIRFDRAMFNNGRHCY